MSVNRTFGYDLTDPTQESFNLNEAPSRGAGSTYKVFVAAAALARGYSTSYTLTTSDPYLSRVYKKDGGPYPVRNAGTATGRRWTSPPRSTSPPTPTSWRWRTPSAASRSRCAWPRRWGSTSSGQEDLPQQVIDENRGSFTFGPDATSPLALASAYSTLAASGTQCDVIPVTAVLDSSGEPLRGDDGEPLPIGPKCTPEAIPPGVANTLNQMLRKDVEPGNPGQTGSARLRPRLPDRRQDGDDAEHELGGLRRLHPGDRRQRDGLQPQGERGRRRLRRRQGRDHLARRHGADPDRPGERGLPAGRPDRRPRQHRPGARLLLGDRLPLRPDRRRLPAHHGARPTATRRTAPSWAPARRAADAR